jgi:type I restriction-modification system DNA methylase subunit
MAHEQFSIPQSASLVDLFDRASNQVGLSRGQVFEDFLTVTKCSLAGGTMEDEYFAVLEKGYKKGKRGKRGIDTLKDAFHKLIDAMETTGQDILGDVFTGAISYAEHGQFFTPDSVCELMGAMSVPTERTAEPRTINDPACGSGRMLLSVAKRQPHWEFTGQDVDTRQHR